MSSLSAPKSPASTGNWTQKWRPRPEGFGGPDYPPGGHDDNSRAGQEDQRHPDQNDRHSVPLHVAASAGIAAAPKAGTSS